ncbi:MAG: lamin tail domain-containing protein, partial [Chitinispirillales bacterium]|nr:lamin tail domain-containing protein [Chitinispirillales bacterium]
PKGVSVVPVSLLLGGERRYIISPKEPLTPGRFESFQNGLYVEHTAAMISDAVRCSIAGIFAAQESNNVPWRLYSRLPAGGSMVEIGSGVFGQDRQFLLTFDIAPEQRQYYFEVRIDGQAVTFPIDLSSFWADSGTLVITEIYPKGGTAAAAGQPEWFELKNVSSAEVNLNGWMFGNSKDTSIIISTDFFLPPGGYLVVTRDTVAMRRMYRGIQYLIRPARWHTLNSFNDTLSVWSPRGIEVDIAAYRSTWFTRWTNQSLERLFIDGYGGTDSASWVLSDRPTPGFPGGASEWRAVSAPSLDIGPIPFSPNGGGAGDVLAIRMKVPPNVRASVRIFSFDGKLLRTFAGEREVIYWDGTTDTGRPAAPGPIYVVAEFASGGGRQVIRKQGILWR